MVALVWDGIGNGPLNIVLPHRLGVALPSGARFAVCGAGDETKVLVLGSPATFSPIAIDLASAVPWNPQPDWDLLRAREPQVVAGAKMIAGILAESGWSPVRCGLPVSVCEGAARGQPAAICELVGLGPGLTPAGDDWLAGWLLARYFGGDLRGFRPTASWHDLEGLIGEVAAERTTTLSRAFLACAAAGEADEMWHALLSVLAMDPTTSLVHDGPRLPSIVMARRAAARRSHPCLEVRDGFAEGAGPRNDKLITELWQNVPAIYRSTAAILAHGATSGAAMLFGFCAGVVMPGS